MKSLFFLLFASAIFFSCNKQEEPQVDNPFLATTIEGTVDFKIVDSTGKNVLSNQVSKPLSYNDINVIVIENGAETVYNKPLLTASKGFLIYGDDNDRYIQLHLNLPTNNNKETYTYLRVGKSTLDTVKAVFNTNIGEPDNYGGSSIIVQKIWYNGVLIFDKAAGIAKELPIIKK